MVGVNVDLGINLRRNKIQSMDEDTVFAEIQAENILSHGVSANEVSRGRN